MQPTGQGEGAMKRRLTGALAALLAVTLAVSAANAVELKVLTASAYRPVLDALQALFETSKGHSLTIEDASVPALIKRIEGGETFDVVVVTQDAISLLAGKSKLAAGTPVPLARIGLGVVVKAGALRPSVATLDEFKKALTAAKTIAYADPPGGDGNASPIEAMLGRIGIGDQIKSKVKRVQTGAVVELVKSGEAAIGIDQTGEIIAVEEISFLGPLPADTQILTTYAAGIGAPSKNAAAAKALLGMLAGPVGMLVLRAKVMEPPGS
jgi:molybdate transport system substrate-binding protein